MTGLDHYCNQHPRLLNLTSTKHDRLPLLGSTVISDKDLIFITRTQSFNEASTSPVSGDISITINAKLSFLSMACKLLDLPQELRDMT